MSSDHSTESRQPGRSCSSFFVRMRMENMLARIQRKSMRAMRSHCSGECRSFVANTVHERATIKRIAERDPRPQGIHFAAYMIEPIITVHLGAKCGTQIICLLVRSRGS